jgi:chromosome segregation ATPase
MITDVDWRLDSNVLASASEDTNIRLWEMQNGGNIKGWGAHGGGVESVRFAKDGRLVSTGRDRVAKVWDQNGAMQKQLEGFNDVALQAVFNHDDQTVIAGDFTGEVRVYELKEGKRLASLAANPPTVAARLQMALQQQEQAQSSVNALTQELAALQNQAGAGAKALADAQAALDAALKAAADAQATLAAAEQSYQQKAQAEAEASKAASAANDESYRVYRVRDAAMNDLYAKSNAAATARQAFEQSRSERDRQVMERANAALVAASQQLQAKLPEWSKAMEAPGPLNVAQTQANTARLLVESALPALRLTNEQAQKALPGVQAARDAATAAKAAADKNVADKQAQLQAAQAQLDAIKAEAAALSSEKQKLDATKASGAQAAVTGTR